MADIICYRSDGQLLDYFTQWDTGQQIIIKGISVVSAPVFYFSNTTHVTSYIVTSEVVNGDIFVDIPDVLLQYAVPLIVYISYTTDDSETTSNTIRVPVKPRQRPSNYVPPSSGGEGSGDSSGSGGSPGTQIDIVNNLTSNNQNAALSAAQGVVLKALIDELDNVKVESEDLPDAISEALNFAIESGIITGIQGEKGDQGDQGLPGRGIVNIYRTDGDGSPGSIDTYTITYSDNTTSCFTVYNGADGEDGKDGAAGSGEFGSGENGATFIPFVDSEGNLSWTNDKNLDNPEIVNIKGPSGDNGFDGVGITKIEQTIKSIESNGINTITITLSDGSTTSFDIMNGARGAAGQHGQNGISISDIVCEQSNEDGGVNNVKVTLSDRSEHYFEIRNGSRGSTGSNGISPIVSTEPINGGTKLTIIDANGASDINVMNGENGLSPTINIEKIEGGNRLSITDMYGTKSVDIKDGKNGEEGPQGQPALINGVNTLKISGGMGIVAASVNDEFRISLRATYSTDDIGAGAYLPTGMLHFVYE